MKTIIPFFELEGQRYEIKSTRYLLAEYNKISEESTLTNEEKQNALKSQSLMEDIQKYASKVKELEDIYFETFNDEDERKYLKIKEIYANALEKFAKFETETKGVSRLQSESINLLEKIAIKGLAEQYFDMNEKEATKVWERFVDTIGMTKATEWLSGMSECLFANDEEETTEENSFLSLMRKKAKEKAENRNKFKSIK